VILVFAALFAALDAGILVAQSRGTFAALTEWTASAAVWLINASGLRATLVEGSEVHVANRVLLIDLYCTGISLVAIFVALVAAYPLRPRIRAMGLLVGIPVIIAANLARIVIAAHVAARAPEAFRFTHDYLLQVGMVLVVGLLWAGWLAGAKRYAR
jgi:exosortase/archaeosortase family protein